MKDKDIQHLLYMLMVAGYMFIKFFLAAKRRSSADTHPDWDEEPWDEESEMQQHRWPVEEPKKEPSYKPKGILPTSYTSKPLPTNKSNQPTTQYPGIKKLLLPIQEKNPYKFYNSTATKPTNKLPRLLKKYSPAQKAIIMAELLKPKTKV